MHTNNQHSAQPASPGNPGEIQEPLKKRANVNKTDPEQVLVSVKEEKGNGQLIRDVISACITNEESAWGIIEGKHKEGCYDEIYAFDINANISDKYSKLTLLQCVLGYDFNGPVLEFLLENGADIQQPFTNDNKHPLKMALERNNYKAIAAMLTHYSISNKPDKTEGVYRKAVKDSGKNIKQEDIIEAFTQKIEEYSSQVGKQYLANTCEVLKNELFKPTRLDEVDAQSLSYDKKIV